MLKVIDVASGRETDFSHLDAHEAVQRLIQGKRDAVTVHLEDCVVSVNFETGTIAAMDQIGPTVAIKHGVKPDLLESLLTLAINDNSPYTGIEKFFEDFKVRFVP